MIQSVAVTIGTGNDDLREGSLVTLRIYYAHGTPAQILSQEHELAAGARFPDRSDLPFPEWRLPNPIDRLQDIQRLEISFVPDRRDFMWPDQWEFRGLRVTVYDEHRHPQVLYHHDHIDHKFETDGTWSTGILPTFSLLTGTVVTVNDEAGHPVDGATVFVDGSMSGRTNAQGQLSLATPLAPTAQIIALRQVHEQGYYRGNHALGSTQNWNYRVYLTNLAIDATGTAVPDVSWDGPYATVALARTNTLIGLNLVATLEWDAVDSELNHLRQILRDCSAFLYNATDGQFFIERAQIFDRANHWDDSDYRVLAYNGYRANVPNITGGFLGWNVLGSCMMMSRGDHGDTYAHEFGHFGLDLLDEYADNDRNLHCAAGLTDPASIYAENQPHASCMMYKQWVAPKICSTYPDNPHVHGTREGDQACWDKLVGRYNYSEQWRLQRPSDRGGIPGTIHFENGATVAGAFLETIFTLTNDDLPDLVGQYTLTLNLASGLPAPGLLVKTHDPGGQWMTQGGTDAAGTVLLTGIHDNDSLRIERADSMGYSAFERDLPGGVTSATVTVPWT